MSNPRYSHEFRPRRSDGRCKAIVGGVICGRVANTIIHQRFVASQNRTDLDDMEQMNLELAAIDSPRRMLAFIVEHEDYLGYYFGDLREAMLKRAKELCGE
jgi:hypothetical protein